MAGSAGHANGKETAEGNKDLKARGHHLARDWATCDEVRTAMSTMKFQSDSN